MSKVFNRQLYTRALVYMLFAGIIFVIVRAVPYNPYSLLTRPVFLFATPLLFTLLLWLIAQLAKTWHTWLGVLITGIFLLLFNPGMDRCMSVTDEGLLELAGQCMVPFFTLQFKRVRKKNFQRAYFLMFLMGIFCSYTHNGVAIPLCASFLWITWKHKERFFKRACWPMVVGFLLGTILSIITTKERTDFPQQFMNISSTTWETFRTLWDTKVFVISIVVTAYLLNRNKGRKMLRSIMRRHYVVTACLAFSLLTAPLAPLGIENAVTGVCFFSMFWLLIITKYLMEKHLHIRV